LAGKRDITRSHLGEKYEKAKRKRKMKEFGQKKRRKMKDKENGKCKKVSWGMALSCCAPTEKKFRKRRTFFRQNM
jgi:hypothetical protein